MSWEQEKAVKRAQRDMKKLQRALAMPVSRDEAISRENMLLQNIASTAIAVEAMETLLVSKGILSDNEVLDAMKALMEQKKAQMSAQQAVEPEESVIIAPV
jgi:hypothetical protein